MLEFFGIGLIMFLIFIFFSGLTVLFIYGMIRLICWLDDEAKERRK